MRTLVVTENTTLDGVVDAEGDWFGPVDADAHGAGMAAVLRQQAAASDALLCGRRTFEDLRAYWAHRADEPTGVGEHLDRVAKYVVSSTLTEPGWEGTTVLAGPVEEEVRALKERPGRDIVVTGSIRLVRGLITAGLVDEYRLFVFPVVLGRGRRLFDGAPGGTGLRLLESRAFGSGVVLLRYAAG